MNILPYSGFPALPKNIEDMHNQLITLGLNDVEALTARIKKCEDWVDTVEETELTGNPVEFQNALALPAKSLETTINAIQDLHGYDKPWVGGAGKNKLPYFTSSTQGNVVFTVNDDGTVDFSGQPSGQAQIEQAVALSAGTYIISGAPNGSSIGAMDIFVQSNNVTIARAYDGASLETSTFTLSDNDNIRVVLRAASSATSQRSGKYKPMICLASAQNPLIYEPYSNICPISGRTEVWINDSGNLAQAEFEQGGINGPITPAVSYNAQKVAMTTRIRTKDLIYLPSGSKFLVDFNGTDFDVVAQSYDEDGLCKVTAYPYNLWVSTATFYESKGSFAIAIRHKDNSNITPSEINNVQLKIYLTSIDVVIQLGTTVYGAEINWDTGVMTVDHKLATFTGAESEGWVTGSGFATGSFYYYDAIPDAVPVEGFGTIANIKTNLSAIKEPAYIVSTSQPTLGIGQGNGKTIYAKLDASLDTVAKFKAYLASNNMQVVYPLATPTTIQLTPTQLQMLKGYNRVSIEDGDITITAYTGTAWEPVTRATKKKAKTKKSKKGGK